MENTVYVVSAVKDKNEEECGVELAGVFSTKEKANEAKKEVLAWLESNGFSDAEVFLAPHQMDLFEWYEIRKQL